MKYNYNLFRRITMIRLPEIALRIQQLRTARLDKDWLLVLQQKREQEASFAEQQLLVLQLAWEDSNYGGQLVTYSSTLLHNLCAIHLGLEYLQLVDLQLHVYSSTLYLYLLTPQALLLVSFQPSSSSLLFRLVPLQHLLHSPQPVGLLYVHPLLLVRGLQESLILNLIQPPQAFQYQVQQCLK